MAVNVEEEEKLKAQHLINGIDEVLSYISDKKHY
jgi:hypothetical protein